MTPETRLDIDVQVLVDDHWYDGTLEHWRQRHGRWEGYCRYGTPGALYVRWIDANDIRKADVTAGAPDSAGASTPDEPGAETTP